MYVYLRERERAVVIMYSYYYYYYGQDAENIPLLLTSDPISALCYQLLAHTIGMF